jgi:hypothetical protein
MGVDSVSGARNQYASYGPPDPDDDDLVCKAVDAVGSDECASTDGETSTAHIREAALPSDSRAKEADYGSVSLSVSLPFLSLSVSHTTDRAGHEYYGLGASVGIGLAPPVGLGASAGKLVRENDRQATEVELRNFLCGDSVNLRAGVAAEAGITNSAAGTAIEWGAATSVGASAGFSHNWGSDCE